MVMTHGDDIGFPQEDQRNLGIRRERTIKSTHLNFGTYFKSYHNNLSIVSQSTTLSCLSERAFHAVVGPRTVEVIFIRNINCCLITFNISLQKEEIGVLRVPIRIFIFLKNQSHG